eukprot:jgi/Mesvir1/7056/Mv09172-RA.1
MAAITASLTSVPRVCTDASRASAPAAVLPKAQQKSCFAGAPLRLTNKARLARASKPAQMPTLATAATKHIESEVVLKESPVTLIRAEDRAADPNSIRIRMEKMIREAQASITRALSDVDGKEFQEDCWMRPGGGGGWSRVLQDGNVFEKAGVNVSVVYGTMPPEAYRAASSKASGERSAPEPVGKEPIPFFAAGISSVVHPRNPMAPTMHFNYRYFEAQAPKDMPGAPQSWWFGGGTDLTPSFLFEEDVKQFHQVYKDICDKHDPEFYLKYKKWCDEYFLIKHRGERRGVGGIFFDDLCDREKEKIFAFAKDCAAGVVPAYVPLVKKHKDDKFTEEQKRWQQLRRGRYAEFNLVYDRGTIFGLKTGGRIESILMSLPLTCRWEYDHKPAPGSREADLLDACMNPRDWLGVEGKKK